MTAYLRERDQRWQREIDRITAEHAAPRDRILAVFDAYEAWMAANDFRGCAFLNAAAKFPDPDHPVREVVRHHKEAMRSYLQAQLRRLWPAGDGVRAAQLMLLLEGGVATCMISGDREPSRETRALAEALLNRPTAAAATPPARS